MVAALDTLRTSALTDDELVAAMAAWRRVTSWAQSCELAAVAELVRRREEQHPTGPPVKVAESIADEIALALTLSGGVAGAWAGLACRLAQGLPRTRQALAKGHIDLARAKVIADGLLGVDRPTAALVEEAVIGAAQRMPAARLRHRVRAAITAVDPQAAEQRRQRARKVRSLEMWATVAGTCELAFREMCEEDAEAIYNRIHAAAQAMKADGDARPIDAIRHDLGVALLRGTPLPEAARDLRASDIEPTGTEPADTEPADRQPTGAKPTGGHTGAQPTNAEPTAEPTGAKPSNAEPTGAQPTGAEPTVGPTGAQSASAQPTAGHTTAQPTGAQTTTRPTTAEPTGAEHPPPGRSTGAPSRTQPPDALIGRTSPDPPDRRQCPDPAGQGWDGSQCAAKDAVTDTAAQISRMLADVIDERLVSVAERHRASGLHTGRAPRIAAAIQAMSDALADLKHHWCRSTATPGRTITAQAHTTTTAQAHAATTAQRHASHAQAHTTTAQEHATYADPTGRTERLSADRHHQDENLPDETDPDRDGHDGPYPGRHLHGHHGYRPPAGMRRLIEEAYRTCAFPTCDRPATTCDLDHTLPWHRGGPTCSCNLAPLCRRHHRVKQHARWHLFQPWPGLLVWLTPAGTWHISHSECRE